MADRLGVEAHASSLTGKLGLITSDEDHRRVQAVLVYLNRTPAGERVNKVPLYRVRR